MTTRQLTTDEVALVLDFVRDYIEDATDMAQPVYGVFHGGDPRNFSPDPDASTAEERRCHQQACEAWQRGERLEFPTHSDIRGADGKWKGRTLNSNFGFGTNYNNAEQDRCRRIRQLLQELDECQRAEKL